jgi:hypothetical protein
VRNCGWIIFSFCKISLLLQNFYKFCEMFFAIFSAKFTSNFCPDTCFIKCKNI